MYLISKGVEIEKRGGEKKSLRGGNDFFNKITLCEFNTCCSCINILTKLKKIFVLNIFFYKKIFFFLSPLFSFDIYEYTPYFILFSQNSQYSKRYPLFVV